MNEEDNTTKHNIRRSYLEIDYENAIEFDMEMAENDVIISKGGVLYE